MENKDAEYAKVIYDKIVQIVKEDDSISEGKNATAFFHALANIVPTLFYNQLTGSDVNSLEFNHIANKLVFQYSKLTE